MTLKSNDPYGQVDIDFYKEYHNEDVTEITILIQELSSIMGIFNGTFVQEQLHPLPANLTSLDAMRLV